MEVSHSTFNANFEYKHTVNQNLFAGETIQQRLRLPYLIQSQKLFAANQFHYISCSFVQTEVMSLAPFFRFDRNKERTDNRWSSVGCGRLERGNEPPQYLNLAQQTGTPCVGSTTEPTSTHVWQEPSMLIVLNHSFTHLKIQYTIIESICSLQNSVIR